MQTTEMSSERWMDKDVVLLTFWWLSLIQKTKWTHAIGINTDGAVDDLTNSGNLETERHISQNITYMWSLKRDTKDVVHKGNTGSQTEKRSVELPEGEIGDRGRMKSDVGINRNTPMYQKEFINDDATDSTGNATKYSSITQQGKESETLQVQLHV